MPADGPTTTGVSATVHDRPRSREWNTRADEPPPLAIQASGPDVTRHVPEAANPNSPGNAAGIPAGDTTVHDRPPSCVAIRRNLPSTGSLTAKPSRGLKNARQS